jgi:hypothetical protein
LKDYVSSIAAHTWNDIVEQLRRSMYCEYEKQWS